VIVTESFDDYVKRLGVNSSLLKEMRRSPKRFHFRASNPIEDTTRLALGRATHTSVFEPDRFAIDFVVFAGPRRAGEEWNKFCAANRGRTILKLDEYATALSMRDAVRAHPAAGPLLASGKPEQTVTWKDEETGLDCKGRIDWMCGGCSAFLDLKTTTDIDADRFGALATRMGYHAQMAFYRAGLLANGLELDAKIVAVEADEPHDVAVFALDEDTLYAGEEAFRDALRRVANCQDRGVWPGRYEAETLLILPPWAFPPEDAEGLGITINGEAA
jgi:hypothetical protein